ncbi:MAG: hypothetical protein N3B01_05645 [Verrucomicrobiae bacterium]|nr:hypothetical protein [Verrucomicrobiae bacterium]
MKCSLLIGIGLVAGWLQAALPQEARNIELVKTLEGKGAFIRIEGDWLFLTSSVNTNAQPPGYWFDIGANPASPKLVCASLPAAWDVAVKGQYAFVCDYTKFFSVYDTRDGQWRQVTKLRMPSMTENVIVRGNHAYVANHTAGLTIVDISTPSKPVIVSNFNPQIDCDAIGLWRDCAILYAHWESRLVLVDVSDPLKPRQIGLYQHDPKTFNQGEIEVDNGFAYCTAVNGLVIVNIVNPAEPKLVSTVLLNGGTTDVVVKDGYAFVAARNGITVLDVRDPTHPTAVGSYPCAAAQLAVNKANKSVYFIYVATKKAPASILQFRPAAPAS